MDKKQVKVNLNIVMVHIIQGHFIIINYMGKEYIYGVMGGNIMVIGNLIELMEKVFLNGLMGENILGIIRMIKNMDMVYLNGLMGKNIKVIGKMGNKMEKEKIIILEIILGLKDFIEMGKK